MKRALLVSALMVSCSTFAASNHLDQWTGFYVGGNLGYGSGHSRDEGNSNSWGDSIDGVVGGIQVGHNWQFDNNIVLGVAANLNLSDMGDAFKNSEHNQYDPYNGSVNIKLNGSVDMLMGYAFDRFLPYVKAGVTIAKEDFSMGCHAGNASKTNGCDQEFNSSTSNIAAGLNVGAGIQYRVTDNLSAGLEYTYVDLGTSSVYMDDPNYPTYGARDFNTSYSTTTLNVNYLF
ncbi:outer membrane protein [Kluyvera chengduensis]|uniref:outer membrane protein n=1 Tax=Kluyvera sp. 142359 TaxID=3375726 RepID=UPI003772148C